MLEHGIVCKSVSVANTAAAMEQQPIDYSDIDSNPDICVYEKQQQKHVRWLKNTPRSRSPGGNRYTQNESLRSTKAIQASTASGEAASSATIYSRTAKKNISYKEPSSPKDSSSNRKAPAMPRRRAATVATSFSAEDETT
jgi:hypothetical protein